MKKITIYALLFAFLVGMTSIQTKADIKSGIIALMNKPINSLLLFSGLGGTIGFGIGSLNCFNKYQKAWKKWENAKYEYETAKYPFYKEVVSKKVKKHLTKTRLEAFKGFACLAGAGLGCYLTYQAIQQAKS